MIVVVAWCAACQAEGSVDPESLLVVWEADAIMSTCSRGHVQGHSLDPSVAVTLLAAGATETSGRPPAELRDVRRDGGPPLTAAYADEWAAKLLRLDRLGEQRVLAALTRSVQASPSGWQRLMAAIAAADWEDEED